MKIKSVVTTLLVVLCLALFVAPAQAQRVIVTPSTYATNGATAIALPSNSTVGSAVAVNISTSNSVMILGLTANAGANTAGVIVWVNLFAGPASGVTAGTTIPIYSAPMQSGGTSNTRTEATIVPWGSPMPVPVAGGLSFNCTTLQNGTIGTQVPCIVNAYTKR